MAMLLADEPTAGHSIIADEGDPLEGDIMLKALRGHFTAVTGCMTFATNIDRGSAAFQLLNFRDSETPDVVGVMDAEGCVFVDHQLHFFDGTTDVPLGVIPGPLLSLSLS